VNSQHVSEKENKSKSHQFEKEVKYDVDTKADDLSEEPQERVLNLFEKWKSIFPKSPMDLGHTSAVRHRIKLLNDEPFKEPCRRIHPALYGEVKQHIHEMLNIGAIRESKSPFSSNVVIVRKKDGTIRFCIDFRKLHARTKKGAYAIPRVVFLQIRLEEWILAG